jgi:hypothetical protein
LVDDLGVATKLAGQIGAASWMCGYPVPVTVTSACTNGVSIDDIEDPGIRHVTVLPWCATAKLLLKLVASRRAECADRICSDLTG